MSDNPYQSPADEEMAPSVEEDTRRAPRLRAPNDERPLPGVSPIGTTTPRHVAAVFDTTVALILAVAAAKQLPEAWVIRQAVVAVLVYFGYFFVFEALTSATPGKLLTGLRIRAFDGGRCTIGQILIRTAFRIVEVNPVFLGGLPAAVQILWTRDKQRLGDRVAGTIVVFR